MEVDELGFGCGSSMAKENVDRLLRPIVTTIRNGLQVTVPPEVRDLYGLVDGDIFEWEFRRETNTLALSPKRIHVLKPAEHIRSVRHQMDEHAERNGK